MCPGVPGHLIRCIKITNVTVFGLNLGELWVSSALEPSGQNFQPLVVLELNQCSPFLFKSYSLTAH